MSAIEDTCLPAETSVRSNLTKITERRVMRKLIIVGAISSIAALAACNGGSSGNDGQRELAGVWSGAVTKVSDTCVGSTAPLSVNFSHNVSQNGESIIVTDENGFQYVGGTLSDDGFSVDSNGRVSGVINCVDNRRIEYQGINKDTDNTATLEETVSRVCSGAENCKISYSGTASRGLAVNPTPTSTPGATGTPVASGGCLAINPNPAAGSYAGDGACGISTAVFRTSGQNIVLEPFGANGATSFVVSATNSSTASSSNVDLTVKGEAGYSCSMACSPPGTFSVTCFKEGGTTCIEKF